VLIKNIILYQTVYTFNCHLKAYFGRQPLPKLTPSYWTIPALGQ